MKKSSVAVLMSIASQVPHGIMNILGAPISKRISYLGGGIQFKCNKSLAWFGNK